MINDKIDYKSAYENVMVANGMLRKENKELHNKIDKAIEYMKENCDILTVSNGYFIRSELTLTGLGELFKILKSKDSSADNDNISLEILKDSDVDE